jgi:hypothetical protein
MVKYTLIPSKILPNIPMSSVFFAVTFVKKTFLPWQDVDAIFRLTRPLPCNFAGLEPGHPSAMAIPPQFLTGKKGAGGLEWDTNEIRN